MRDRTTDFDTQIKRSHFTIQRADLYRRGELVQQDIPVLGGTWSEDKTANIRMRCSLTLEPTDELIPTTRWREDSGMWPVGNEIQLKVGLRLPSGKPELIPCGRYRISTPVVQDDGQSLSLSVEGYDRSRAVSRNAFTKPYGILKDVPYSTAIKDLIKSRLPTLAPREYLFHPTTDQTNGYIFFPNDDPWLMALRMAESCGMELFFDGLGRCVLRPERAAVKDYIDWDYSEGEESNLLAIGRKLDDEKAFNGVILDANHSRLPRPIHYELWDTDKESSTWFNPWLPEQSTYGAVPYFLQSEYVTNTGQAKNAALSTFHRVTGIAEDISFNGIVHPAHEAGDIIRAKRTRAHVEGLYTMDALSFELGPQGVMQANCRQRRLRDVEAEQ